MKNRRLQGDVCFDQIDSKVGCYVLYVVNVISRPDTSTPFLLSSICCDVLVALAQR